MRSSYVPSLLVLVSTLGGCDSDGDYATPTPYPTPYPDFDGDGFDAASDCNDKDKNTHPYAPEFPDGADNNCNGIIDEGTELDDQDNDGWSTYEGDCDDHNGDIHPGSWDDLDGIDNDCDGVTDEDFEGAPVFEPNNTNFAPAGADAVFYHPQPTNGLSAADMQVATWLGDIDHDGYDDSAVSELWGDGTGRVWILYGHAAIQSGERSYDNAAGALLVGIAQPNTIGAAILGQVDLNGDGMTDLVVGDPHHRQVGIFFGGTRLNGEVSLDRADVMIRTGEDSGFLIGRFLAGPDMDGDGLNDLLVGQPDQTEGAGRVSVFYGRTEWPSTLDVTRADAWISGDASFDFVGFDIAAVGDLDEDGDDEFVVGAPGALVTSPADNDGDGYPDQAPVYGKVGLFNGDPHRLTGTTFFSQAPLTLTSAAGVNTTPITVRSGDFDGDQTLDLAVGLPFARLSQGVVYLHYGGTSSAYNTMSLESWAQTKIVGRTDDSDYQFGTSLDFGDLNQDGAEELVIVTPASYNSTSQLGYVMTVPGNPSRPVAVNLYSDGVMVKSGNWGGIEQPVMVDLSGDDNKNGVPDMLLGVDTLPGGLSSNATFLYHY